MLLFQLFTAFARIGGLTFGGGYAMLPMLQSEVVERYGWCSESELTDYFAIGQCTPGVIAVNTATFVGYKQGGVAGALAATFGVVAPSLVIITTIAACLQNFADMPVVQYAFSGIRVAVCVLILKAISKLWKKSVVDRPTLLIFALVFVCSAFLDISPAWLVVAAGIAGNLLGWRQAKNRANSSTKTEEDA